MKDRPILRDPTVIKKADFLIMESTYGNRLHPKEEGNIEALMEIVEATAKQGGTASFSFFLTRVKPPKRIFFSGFGSCLKITECGFSTESIDVTVRRAVKSIFRQVF